MSLQACAELVERADPDRFLAAMAAPVAARRVLFPLYAFNVEVSRAPWVTREPMIAEMRLQWWRDALDQIAGGGPVRRHEVVEPLAQVLDGEGARLLDELVAARRFDIETAPFGTRAEFDDYIAHTAGNLLWVAARALGAADPEPAMAMGQAMGIANWLRAVPELEARGRLPLVDGRPEAVAELAREGLAHLRRVRKLRGRVPASAAPAFLAGWRAGPVLARAASNPLLVKEGRLEGSEASRRASLIWRSFSGRW